jgi:iron complex transport system ATP-binding protein
MLVVIAVPLRAFPTIGGADTQPAVTLQTAALVLDDVGFTRDGRTIIGTLTLRVEREHRWLVLGANGSGKTTLLRIAALYEHPSTGTVDVLGERLGRTDVRTLRRRIGYASSALFAQLRVDLRAVDVVMTAKYAALEPWWHRYDDDDVWQATQCLRRMGVGRFAERTLGTLSSGEQQRVLLARTLMNDPAVVLLDEPAARLDIAGREQLVGALAELAADRAAPPLVLVTHHVDEVPPGMTHALLLRDGNSIAQGSIDDVLSSESLSECFGLPLVLERRADGRLSAWSRR